MEGTQDSTQVKPDPNPVGHGSAAPEGTDGGPIEITIKSQDNSEVKFRVKSHTPFQKVFNAWGKKKGVDSKLYRFLGPEGERIQPPQTPFEVGVHDGDTIDAMILQEGGCFA